MKTVLIAAALGLCLAGCHSTRPDDYRADQDCLQRQVGHKILTSGIGIGLGFAGVPGGGLIGSGVGLFTNPRCQTFHLTDEAMERIARERATRARLAGAERSHRARPERVAPFLPERPLDPTQAMPAGRP